VSRIGKNLVYLLMSQVATWSVTLLALIVVPRMLGPAAFGQFGFATNYVALFATIAGLGTSPLLIKLVAREHSVLSSLVANAVLLKLIVVTLLTVVAIAVARLIGTTGVPLVLVAVGCVGMLLIVLNDIFAGALVGLERMGRPALWSVVKVAIASVGGVLIILAGGGVVAYAAVVALAGAAPLLANAKHVWPRLTGAKLDLSVWKLLVVGGVPLMMLSGLIKVYGTIDTPILRGLTDDVTVGWYTLSYRLVTVPIFIATTTVTAFFPSFSAHGASQSPEFSRQVNKAIRLVVMVSVPAAAGISAVADDLIMLMSGPRYAEAAPIMQILALHLPFAAVGFVLGSALIASDKQNKYVVIAAISALLSPILYVFAIRWADDRYGNGGIGAAAATLIIEILMFTGALVIRSPGVMDRWTTVNCLRAVAAGGVMTAVVWALSDVPLALRVAIGIAVYAAAALAFRAISSQEIRDGVDTFRGALTRKKARPAAEVAP
jgi:O-antigen/teichoic acid export membrane protein